MTSTLHPRSILLRFFLSTLILGALLFTSSASAQTTGSISGNVIPAHDHPLTLAKASIPDLGLEVKIAADGTFRFDSVRPGSHVIRILVPTLGTSLERVTVIAGEETEVEIEITAGSHFEEIVVTTPGDGRDPLELSNPITNLSGQELALRSQSSLGETLSQEAGVSSSFFGPGASRPIIRGLSGDRVRVMEGGIGTGDVSGVSGDHAVTSDPSQAERIEILRGPATLLYGSSAIGGAVNIIDERIPTTRASRPIGGTVDLRAGSVSDERQGGVNLGGGAGDWAWHVDGVVRDTDDYEAPSEASPETNGEIENSDLETVAGRFGITRFFDDRGYIGFSIGGFETEYGVPGGHGHGHDDDHGDEDHGDDDHDDDDHGDDDHDDDDHDEEEEETVRIDMQQQRLDGRGELRGDLGIFQALKFRLGATDYEHIELEGDEEGTLFFNDYLETRIELVQKSRGRASGSMGLQYSDRSLEAIGAEAFIPATDTERIAAFTFQEFKTGPWSWQFGARVEDQDQDARGLGAVSHTGLSGSLGLVWTANETWSIGASLARSAKLPAAEELFSNGPHLASQTFEIGNLGLDEEVGLGVDVSLRKKEGKLTGELTLFHQDFDDFIFQAFTGDIEDGLPVIVYSQQDAELQGAELKTRLELLERDGHHLHFQLVADMVDAELDAGGDLPRIPPLRIGGGFHYHSENWTGTAEVRWIDDQNDIGVNESPTDGYTLVNASVGYRLLFGGQIVELLLRGRNLTDEVARTHTSFLKDFAPLPGRDVSLSARFWF